MISPAIARRPNVLVVDDESGVCKALVEALPKVAGNIATAPNAASAISLLEHDSFDVILCDFYMPGGGGLELLQHTSEAHWDIGFILMTGKPQLNDIVSACRLHAADILLKPFSLDALHGAVERTYARISQIRSEHLQRSELRQGLRHRSRELAGAKQQLCDIHREIIESMIMILDLREHETCAHSFRVRSYALCLAREINYADKELHAFSTAALLHDIGKVAIPDQILLKPTKLDPTETTILQRHSAVGGQIALRSTMLRDCAPVIRHHHERWDGTGYPDRLFQEEIPLGARVFALADTLDAMTSDRCYRPSLSLAQVHAEVDRCSGTQFDPEIAKVFQTIPDELWLHLRKEADSLAHELTPPHQWTQA